jgi:hypothetical protein
VCEEEEVWLTRLSRGDVLPSRTRIEVLSIFRSMKVGTQKVVGRDVRE